MGAVCCLGRVSRGCRISSIRCRLSAEKFCDSSRVSTFKPMTNTAEGARGTSANATIALFSLSLSPRDVYNMRSTDERRPSAPTQSLGLLQRAQVCACEFRMYLVCVIPRICNSPTFTQPWSISSRTQCRVCIWKVTSDDAVFSLDARDGDDAHF